VANSTADLSPKGRAPIPNRSTPASQPSTAQPEPKDRRTFKVTYRPGPEDRARTVWNGITFTANQPVTLSLDNPRHYIENDLPKAIDGPDGEIATRTRRVKMFMGELAKTNPHFEVEGFPRYIKKLAEGRRPQTSDEYRTWAQTWFAEAGDEEHPDAPQTPREMLERWDDEDAMRERCGVSDEDIGFLKPFFDMKVSMLKGNVRTKHAKNDGGEDLAAKPRFTIEDEFGDE
jgi:hypothetical protein